MIDELLLLISLGYEVAFGKFDRTGEFTITIKRVTDDPLRTLSVTYFVRQSEARTQVDYLLAARDRLLSFYSNVQSGII